MPIGNQAVKVVATANGINGKLNGGTLAHMGMTTFNDRAPNSPYVAMIHPNVVYQPGGAGYVYDLQQSGASTGYSVKAPMTNGPRYTVLARVVCSFVVHTYEY